MASIEDRWLKAVTGADGRSRKVKTERHGNGKRYRVHWLDPDGRHRSKSFDRKQDAERFKSVTKADMLRGTYIDPEAGAVTFRAYAEQILRDRTIDEGTRTRRRKVFAKHVYPVIGSRQMGQLSRSPSTIQSLIRSLRQDLEDSTANVVMGDVSMIFNCAIDDEKTAKNPCRAASVTMPKRPKRKITPWTEAQIAAMRHALASRYKATVDTGAGIGLRQGEIFGLSPDRDIDWLRGVIHVTRQVKVTSKQIFAPPKGNKERDVPLPETVKLALSEHLRRHPPRPVTLPWRTADGPPLTVALIFTTEAGYPVRGDSFNDAFWRPALRAAGIAAGRENGMHALRHYFASKLLHEGAGIKDVQEWLGHALAATTLELYGHMMPGGADRMKRIIDEALGGGFPQDHYPGVAQEGDGT